MNYGYKKQLKQEFPLAVIKVKEALLAEGFGVLTEINIKETLKNKLDVEFSEYIILGACNPEFAYKALQAEQEIGLFLPCNVIVYEKDESVYVSAIKPAVVMSMVENEVLSDIAQEVEDNLMKVIEMV